MTYTLSDGEKDITSYENEISKLQNELTAYKRRLQEIAEMYANKVECVRCELKDICSKYGTSHEIECIEVLTKI